VHVQEHLEAAVQVQQRRHVVDERHGFVGRHVHDGCSPFCEQLLHFSGHLGSCGGLRCHGFHLDRRRAGGCGGCSCDGGIGGGLAASEHCWNSGWIGRGHVAAGSNGVGHVTGADQQVETCFR